MNRAGRDAVAIAAGVAALFLLFSPPAVFLQWDDARNLLDHDRWRGLSWSHLAWMWSTRHNGPWQPLSWLSWAADYALWGLDPAAFRRTNVLLHSGAAAFLYLACRRLLGRGSSAPAAAAGAALFFALHPLRAESVLWITERRDVLSGFFSALSLYLWLDERPRRSALAFAAAALSKGTAVAVVPFLFLLDVAARGRAPRESARSLLPHAVVALLAAAENLAGLRSGDLPALSLGAADRLLLAASNAWFYLRKTLIPSGLSPYYALPRDLASVRSLAAPGAACAAAVTALCLHRRARAWAPPVWGAYLLALAPVSGLLQNGRQAAADRYTYLACLPFALLFGLAAARLSRRRAIALVACVSSLLAVATVRQAAYWRDDVSLWTRAVAVEPEAYLPVSNLSVALLTSGRPAEAVPYLETAIRLEPRDAQARVNLAAVLAARGEERRAAALFREALALRPDDPSFASARFNLGVLLTRQGRKRDGLAQMREAARLDPSLARRLPR